MKRKLVSIILLLIPVLVFSQSPKKSVEKWGVYEVTLKGPSTGNPFVGLELSAVFTNGKETFEPDGFYDGNGIFKIRFMPDKEGTWTYVTHSNNDKLNGIKGSFFCTPPSDNDHGPVKVSDTYNFSYADGTRFIPFGTTIYEWCFSPDSIRKETIATMKHSPFNKARMLVLPPFNKRYLKGPYKLDIFPFEGTPPKNWNYARFNPAFFQRIENGIKQLNEIGVQADVILLNPYDGGWGFENVDLATDKRLIKYCVARFAAYRNVWWSLSNENSFIESLTDKDWDQLFKLVQRKDPYHHLRSIHNGDRIYHYTEPWVTHVSLQNYNASKEPGVVPLLRDIYRKPIILDEINYEGNINSRWGQLTGQQMTHRFWTTYVGGGYATHGESYKTSRWISNGGGLIGTSPARIAFLKKIVDAAPALNPIDQAYILNLAGEPGNYYLKYFGKQAPKQWKFELPHKNLKDGMRFKVEIIDTWNMTITQVNKIFEVKKLDNYYFIDKENRSVKLPGKPYMALRITRIE
ncbi:hypothetical protein PbJCM13498_01790 [Prolixibacter bellariivorans]|uniref:DUF5060 domain-containing protein n=1 Tax=Prolixibacter bellariivorans TaxID=314319 RepID=A0A5M4AUS7_9BACT|nr:DUF5060 domain-containing protein [Prolixibacter bellariivorans]GET31316.1 hypothetical protein PbJCM13498_01790 [Prolixibacter bellariivorans]